MMTKKTPMFYYLRFIQQRLIVVFMLALLAACSGSLSSDEETDNSDDSALRVYLGDDINLPIGSAPIQINSIVRGINDPFVYQWSIQPSRFVNAISANDTADITFEIPADETSSSQVVLTLKVFDSAGLVESDQLFINITPVNTLPIIDLTVDDTDKVVDSGQGVNFSATWVDAEDGELVASAVLTAKQISGVTLAGLPTDGIVANFPIVDDVTPALAVIADNQLVNSSTMIATVEYTLTVTDTLGGVVTSSVLIDILPINQSAPVVTAGNNQVVYQGQQVVLNGAVFNSTTSQFLWSQTGGGVLIDDLNGQDKTQLQFTAPYVTSAVNLEFQFSATNLSTNRRNVDFVTITVLPISAFDGINDTGIGYCADGLTNDGTGSCGLNNYPRQDGDFGRDAAYFKNGLDKMGGGEAGFDFTLLDDAGEEIFTDEAPSCVRDNVTGLIWEVKSTSGIRAYTHTFTWYNTSTENGGDEGIQNTNNVASCFNNSDLVNCNTQAYINAVNSVGLCGANDWRLPKVRELVSILNYAEKTDKMALGANNTQLWPNHAQVPIKYYWTSQSSIFGVNNTDTPISPNAWVVDLSTGDEISYSKRKAAAILLVR